MKVLTKELDTYEKTNANNPHSKHTAFRAQTTVADNLNLFSPKKFSLTPLEDHIMTFTRSFAILALVISLSSPQPLKPESLPVRAVIPTNFI
jgi:hypothetical protein